MAEVVPADSDGLKLPPWKVCPEIKYRSIGWRMGGGEDVWLEHSSWYASQTATIRSEYRARYPEPLDWRGFYEAKHDRLNLEDLGTENG